LRIGIASAGRFHVLDLARELSQLGHDVRFYSYVPKSRGRRFGLADACQAPVTGWVSPLLAWQRLAPRLGARTQDHLMHLALDRAVAARLEPCDVFIFMSGIYLEAARAARRRFGARLWLERGSAHIETQDEILATIPGAERPSRQTREREVAGYALADRIVIASRFSERSFAGRPEAAKLFRNPYGVDLEHFPLSPRPPLGDTLRLIFVGAWSRRKGCDLLTAAVRAAPGGTLTHVGAITDLAFPSDDARFRHIDPVDQLSLKDFYAEADALILASREEGFGLVLGQAMAMGLPVICTDRTGGPDLAHTPALAERIVVAAADDAPALTEAIAVLRRRLACGAPSQPLTDVDRQTLTWRAYAERYSDELVADAAGSRAAGSAP
jgi:glycosyltransferase involved in cell wall biosynthesis